MTDLKAMATFEKQHLRQPKKKLDRLEHFTLGTIMTKCSLPFKLKRSLKVRTAMRAPIRGSGCCVLRRSVNLLINYPPRLLRKR